MNPAQLATMDEAKTIAARLGTIGGGVVDTYIPQYLGPYAAPEMGDAKFYHFAFKNGADGFNVGLVRDTMRFFPSRWPLMIQSEVDASGRFSVTGPETPAPAVDKNGMPVVVTTPAGVDSVVGIPDALHEGEFLPADGADLTPFAAPHTAKDGTKYVVVAHGSGFCMLYRWKVA